MRYLPLTDAEREEMKKAIGIADVKELFSCHPVRTMPSFPWTAIPAALARTGTDRRFQGLRPHAIPSPDYLSFLGAGAYAHFIPEVVSYLSAKGEFLTPYTPYQPEVSQGNLQAMFEYQTMMTMLTGLDVANASLYDGGTAAAEAVLLAVRKSGRSRVLLAANLHPEYVGSHPHLCAEPAHRTGDRGRSMNGTAGWTISDLRAKLDDARRPLSFSSRPIFWAWSRTAGPSPRPRTSARRYAVQVVAEAMSLAFLASPADFGVDMVVGEAQSFGLPLGFGGPYLGFMAAREEFLRQMPGRIVGQTVDLDGKRGYVLTLSTREQHIKREKATSNICTNEAWCAMRAGMYLAAMGKTGLAGPPAPAISTPPISSGKPPPACRTCAVVYNTKFLQRSAAGSAKRHGGRLSWPH